MVPFYPILSLEGIRKSIKKRGGVFLIPEIIVFLLMMILDLWKN